MLTWDAPFFFLQEQDGFCDAWCFLIKNRARELIMSNSLIKEKAPQASSSAQNPLLNSCPLSIDWWSCAHFYYDNLFFLLTFNLLHVLSLARTSLHFLALIETCCVCRYHKLINTHHLLVSSFASSSYIKTHQTLQHRKDTPYDKQSKELSSVKETQPN
jgi:hypothetical protein